MHLSTNKYPLAAEVYALQASQRAIDQVEARIAHLEEQRAGPSASVTIDRSVVVGTNTAGVDNTSVNTGGGDYAEGEIRK